VFGANDETARTVADLAAPGIAVAAIVDPRIDIPGSIEAVAKSTGARLNRRRGGDARAWIRCASARSM